MKQPYPAGDAFRAPSRASVSRWPFFSTPLRTFLAAMLPILALMGLLAGLSGVPVAIRFTAGAVIACSLYALWRGYLHWLEVSATGIAYCTPLTRIHIVWPQVRRIERYTPPDRNRLTQYVYVTRLDQAPADRHVIDADTLQLQDRPGLLAALQACWRQSTLSGSAVEKAAAPCELRN